MTYFVYLIGCNKNNKFTTYVGYTKNLKKRIDLWKKFASEEIANGVIDL